MYRFLSFAIKLSQTLKFDFYLPFQPDSITFRCLVSGKKLSILLVFDFYLSFQPDSNTFRCLVSGKKIFILPISSFWYLIFICLFSLIQTHFVDWSLKYTLKTNIIYSLSLLWLENLPLKVPGGESFFFRSVSFFFFFQASSDEEYLFFSFLLNNLFLLSFLRYLSIFLSLFSN